LDAGHNAQRLGGAEQEAHGPEQMASTGPETTNPAAVLVQSQEQGTGMSRKEEIALWKIKSFCANLLKMLAPPLLKEIESSKDLRADAEPFTPKRLTRSTAASRASRTAGKMPRKVSTADTVLLTALGIAPSELTVNEAHLEELQQIFDSPLRDQHLRAIAALYGKTLPRDLNMVEQCQCAVSSQ
jgi:hypothetical protein